MGRTSQATRQPRPLTPPCNLHAPAADTLKVPHPGMVPWWGRMVLHLRNRAQEKFSANAEWRLAEVRIQGGSRVPTGHPCLATPRFRREDFLDAPNVRVNLGCQEEVRRLPFASAWKAVGISQQYFRR